MRNKSYIFGNLKYACVCMCVREYESIASLFFFCFNMRSVMLWRTHTFLVHFNRKKQAHRTFISCATCSLLILFSLPMLLCVCFFSSSKLLISYAMILYGIQVLSCKERRKKNNHFDQLNTCYSMNNLKFYVFVVKMNSLLQNCQWICSCEWDECVSWIETNWNWQNYYYCYYLSAISCPRSHHHYFPLDRNWFSFFCAIIKRVLPWPLRSLHRQHYLSKWQERPFCKAI